MSRPGYALVSQHDQVGLIPPPGDGRRAGVPGDVPRAHPAPTWVYVDMTTPPVWDGEVVRAVDLDLDVIRMREGSVVVDDEDEFAEHQVTLGYPPEVVALAEASRDRVHAAILDEAPPYDGSHERWLAVLHGLTAGR